MRTLILVGALVGALAGCDGDQVAGGCSNNGECGPGNICADGSCMKLCVSDRECAGGQICEQSICTTGQRGNVPEITGINGTGSALPQVPDSRGQATDNRLRQRIALLGLNLEGAEVSMVDDSSAALPLTIESSSATEIVVSLPSSAAAGHYLLTARNGAGSDQVEVWLLQGEPGVDGAAGADGADGATGPEGPTGPAGPLPAVATGGGIVGDGSSGSPIALDAAVVALRSKSTYVVWGRSTCPSGDSFVHEGYAGAFGGSQGAMGGNIMCLDAAMNPTAWNAWAAALVSRAESTSDSAGQRSQYMQTGDVHCAVCKGQAYTLWGRTTCGAGDTALYAGHIAHFAYNTTSGGANNAGPFCMDDGATGLTWTDWGGNSILARAAGAGSSPYAQYMEARDGLCVVCR